jgi:hypothetical protein
LPPLGENPPLLRHWLPLPEPLPLLTADSCACMKGLAALMLLAPLSRAADGRRAGGLWLPPLPAAPKPAAEPALACCCCSGNVGTRADCLRLLSGLLPLVVLLVAGANAFAWKALSKDGVSPAGALCGVRFT